LSSVLQIVLHLQYQRNRKITFKKHKP